eukprot:m.166277 g.166277  ORF g.166277 m.166277 type:complete len:54 (-) comp16618_c0_seq4:353-514(-)
MHACMHAVVSQVNSVDGTTAQTNITPTANTRYMKHTHKQRGTTYRRLLRFGLK